MNRTQTVSGLVVIILGIALGTGISISMPTRTITVTTTQIVAVTERYAIMTTTTVSKTLTNSTIVPTCVPFDRRMNPWIGVENPARLSVHSFCAVAVGVVEYVYLAKDGDVHIEIRLLAGYEHLLNEANNRTGHPGGRLVVEVIPYDQGEPACTSELLDPEARICGPTVVNIPKLNQTIRVEGIWVTDLWHEWNEIHPAWNITVVQG